MLAISLSFCPTPTSAGQCITKKGYIFAANKELLSKAVHYIAQKDDEALTKLAKTGLVGVLKPGIPVFLEDTSVFSGTVEFRPKGSTTTMWTVIEGLDCHQN